MCAQGAREVFGVQLEDLAVVKGLWPGASEMSMKIIIVLFGVTPDSEEEISSFGCSELEVGVIGCRCIILMKSYGEIFRHSHKSVKKKLVGSDSRHTDWVGR